MLASPSVFQLPVAPRPREPQKTLADLTKRLDSGKSTQRRGPGQGEGRAQRLTAPGQAQLGLFWFFLFAS